MPGTQCATAGLPRCSRPQRAAAVGSAGWDVPLFGHASKTCAVPPANRGDPIGVFMYVRCVCRYKTRYKQPARRLWLC